jgi:isoleucyl-tRNA synthetase
MESVWWVFKQLFDKGLVYRGFKASAVWCVVVRPGVVSGCVWGMG